MNSSSYWSYSLSDDEDDALDTFLLKKSILQQNSNLPSMERSFFVSQSTSSPMFSRFLYHSNQPMSPLVSTTTNSLQTITSSSTSFHNKQVDLLPSMGMFIPSPLMNRLSPPRTTTRGTDYVSVQLQDYESVVNAIKSMDFTIQVTGNYIADYRLYYQLSSFCIADPEFSYSALQSYTSTLIASRKQLVCIENAWHHDETMEELATVCFETVIEWLLWNQVGFHIDETVDKSTERAFETLFDDYLFKQCVTQLISEHAQGIDLTNAALLSVLDDLLCEYIAQCGDTVVDECCAYVSDCILTDVCELLIVTLGDDDQAAHEFLSMYVINKDTNRLELVEDMLDKAIDPLLDSIIDITLDFILFEDDTQQIQPRSKLISIPRQVEVSAHTLEMLRLIGFVMFNFPQIHGKSQLPQTLAAFVGWCNRLIAALHQIALNDQQEEDVVQTLLPPNTNLSALQHFRKKGLTWLAFDDNEIETLKKTEIDRFLFFLVEAKHAFIDYYSFPDLSVSDESLAVMIEDDRSLKPAVVDDSMGVLNKLNALLKVMSFQVFSADSKPKVDLSIKQRRSHFMLWWDEVSHNKRIRYFVDDRDKTSIYDQRRDLNRRSRVPMDVSAKTCHRITYFKPIRTWSQVFSHATELLQVIAMFGFRYPPSLSQNAENAENAENAVDSCCQFIDWITSVSQILISEYDSDEPSTLMKSRLLDGDMAEWDILLDHLLACKSEIIEYDISIPSLDVETVSQSTHVSDARCPFIASWTKVEAMWSFLSQNIPWRWRKV
jgi:hypothetical protein